MTNLSDYEKNRQILFDIMHAFERPFTATELEIAFQGKITNGFHEVDRYQSFQELLLDLETYGSLEKEGAHYRVLLEETT